MEAMNLLAEADFSMLHRQIRRRVHWSEVEDVAQEIYIDAIRYVGPEVRDPNAFLNTLTARAVADYHESRHRRCGRVLADSLVFGEVAERCASDEDIEAQLCLTQQCAELLALLPANQAAALVLHECDGLSHIEVAEELGLSLHTVKKYLVKAKSRIRSVLGIAEINGSAP
jgi:RNA polymerase sigma factor (sigma-70 family)